jgi:exodeoxyribonuclease-5
MSSESLLKKLFSNFKHTPSKGQELSLQLMADFIVDKKANKLFMLKGYAGTGKTTLLSTLIETLKTDVYKTVLMAPTGRAAKVMSQYANQAASTIHKKIYFPKSEKNGSVSFVLQVNKHRKTIFIVDEASMISDDAAEARLFENGSLLADLFQYVHAGIECKLMFIGDTAQLPPVKQLLSPALDAELLSQRFSCEVVHIELEEVLRQAQDSGILYNATQLRNQLLDRDFDTFKFRLNNFQDIVRLLDGESIQEAISTAFNKGGTEDTVIIVRSNKRANLYNQQIRARIFFKESELSEGDSLMVVKNNYYWIDKDSDAGFIANGDLIEVVKLHKIVSLYGFRFAEARVRMIDYPNQKPFETVLLLDTLTSESPSLTYEQSNRLYQEILKDYAGEKSKYKQLIKVKSNKYFNALQVKFSYAVTCHKSQGGQWKNVFVEQPYLPDGIDEDYLRWLYTAVTRASEKLFLIGFKDDYFEND